VRAAMGGDAFEAVLAEGRAMTPGQAAAHALAPIEAPPKGKATEKHAGRKHAGLLTPPEREVTTLIAQGLTNRKIASSLAIAERTVDAHVEHLLNKLGFTSRTQVAAWAVETGLHRVSTD